MYIEVYLDVVFMINFIMDFLILWILSVVSNNNAKLKRLLMGAFLGALLMCAIVMVPALTKTHYMVVIYLLISVAMVEVAFRVESVKELIKLTMLMYIIAISLGGIMFFLYYYTNIGYFIRYSIGEGTLKEVSLSQLLIYIVVTGFLAGIIAPTIIKTISVHKKLFKVTLKLKGKEVCVNAFLDTGNNLFDPITNSPVVIGDKKIFEGLLEQKEYNALSELAENMSVNTMEVLALNKMVDFHIRLIPYTSIGNENGMLLGIVVDKIYVRVGNETKVKDKVVLAIYNKALSHDRSYHMLLHPNLI